MPLLTILYAIAIFLGSFLLFLVEPIAGKRLLPLLGGSAAVWTTCLVFFQTALLLGYLLAHWLATRLRPRTQAFSYIGLLVLAFVQSALNLQPSLHASTLHPIRSVFVVLGGLIGLPFLALSATNPLLQSWYSRGFAQRPEAGHVAGEMVVPPYRLFALSNFGSLLALVVYPWLVEPRYSLHGQSAAWLGGLMVFVLACAGIVWQSVGRTKDAKDVLQTNAAASTGASDQAPPRLRDRLLWLLLAACGSILLCSFTNHLSQNVAAIPLLWILPLIAYLLSFVWAFNGERYYPRYVMLALMAVFLGSAGYLLWDTRLSMPLTVTVAFYCVSLLIACLVCHAEIYRLRPSPRYVTSFYLLIAAGGALGSMCVGIGAPLVLRANHELVWSLVLTMTLVLVVTWQAGILARLFWLAATAAMLAVVFAQIRHDGEDAIAQVRNFYGALRVTQTDDGSGGAYTRTLINGTILHGTQTFSDELRRAPTSYYAHDSGVGLAIDSCCGDRPRRVGIIGLGAGTIAAYGRKGDVFRFYDINPLVEHIAKNLFSYLRESQAQIEIVPGDARLSLAAEPPQNYDVLVVDAFSGDAIPVHLLTAEAIELYKRHLNPDGILAVHVSNQFLNLVPVAGQQAEHAGMQSLLVSSDENEDTGEFNSDWVLITNNRDFLALKEVSDAGEKVELNPRLRLWTDDYNSLLPLLKHQKFEWDK